MSAASGAGKRPTTIVLRVAPASTEAEAILEIITGLLPNALALFAPASAEVASALNSIPQHPVIIDGFHFSKSYTGVARTVKTHQLTPVYLRTQVASPTPLVIISGVEQQWRRDIFDWTIELSLHHRGHDSISTFDGVADLSELLQAWLQQSETQYEDRISFDQLHQLMSRAGSWHTVLNIANQCGESHYFNVWNFALAHAALDCAVDLDRIHILCREALKQGRTHIASDDLLRGLNAFRQQAVGETSAVMLARALGRYGVPPPQTVRLGPFETRKGYSVACILDALNPYFPCADAQQVV